MKYLPETPIGGELISLECEIDEDGCVAYTAYLGADEIEITSMDPAEAAALEREVERHFTIEFNHPVRCAM
ncbi:hypothetical protein UFOVP141_36 [uncultured Caudovirales phage]|uniref:Uncharacterized protein n=1 Tax=uncultured Caudovirales phage TaxID=2100421 RepID=A0A6J7VPQ4_9CAUD|nr:hypothetical protein UFOVP141_36 [uncultured Caudovirales phage]